MRQEQEEFMSEEEEQQYRANYEQEVMTDFIMKGGIVIIKKPRDDNLRTRMLETWKVTDEDVAVDKVSAKEEQAMLFQLRLERNEAGDLRVLVNKQADEYLSA